MGVKIIVKTNNTDNAEIQNQSPLVYVSQTANKIHRAKYIESGSKINLCFLISLGRLVKVKDNNKEESTIQNQLNVLFMTKSQIKQGISATA